MFTFKKTYPVLLLLVFLSCSRNNTPAGKNCRVISETINDGTTVIKLKYEYNSDGKLSRSLRTGGYDDTVTYSYSGNKIFREGASGGPHSFDTSTVNDAGFLLHGQSGTHTTDCVYDANGQLVSYSQRWGSNPPQTSTYVFTNGDYTSSLGSDGSTDTLSYDLSKPASNVEEGELYRLTYGVYTIKSKHLLLSEKQVSNTGTFIANYSYQFDGNGNVSTITIKNANNATTTISFIYACQ